MDLTQEVARGDFSQRCLDDLQARLDRIKVILHKEWQDSKAEDKEGRERAWLMLHALTELERSYLRDINTGKLAQAKLEEERNG